MPPKAAPPGQQRPVSANDLQITKLEGVLATIADSEGKWRERRDNAVSGRLQNYTQMTVIEACLQACGKLVSDLDRLVERIVPSRADSETKDDKTKKKDGATPTPSAYKIADMNEVTDILLKFYRFDAGIALRDAATPQLVTTLKRLARAAAGEVEGEVNTNKQAAARGRAIVALIDLSRVVLDNPDEAPPSALPCPGGIDSIVWTEMLDLRSRRMQVMEATLSLQRERLPLSKRHDNIASMSSLAEYALGAVAHNKSLIDVDLKEKEAARAAENAQWAEKLKAQGAPAGKK